MDQTFEIKMDESQAAALKSDIIAYIVKAACERYMYLASVLSVGKMESSQR